MKNVLAKVIAYAGPGGCCKLKRGEKAYLMKKKELTGQLSELDCDDLVFIINYWINCFLCFSFNKYFLN